MSSGPYAPRRVSSPRVVQLRGLGYHVQVWGEPSQATPQRPVLVLLHGWMDVGASFQFVVDELAAADGFDRFVIAPDWRGFGLTDAPGADSYWFPDYLGDLDALLEAFSPDRPVDLLGHSMGGNVAMSYAGVRPLRVRRLANLEGFGMPRTEPHQAPQRLARWLDELRTPFSLRDYASLEDVAARLQGNNPRLTGDKAAWLARHWAERRSDGRWHVRGDPAHKRVNPILYRVDEILATWRLIQARLLWIEGDGSDTAQWWGRRYSKAEFHERLAVVPQVDRHVLADCGHMLHHDQPAALAAHLATFLSRP